MSFIDNNTFKNAYYLKNKINIYKRLHRQKLHLYRHVLTTSFDKINRSLQKGPFIEILLLLILS